MIFNSPEDAVKLTGYDPKAAIHKYRTIYGIMYIFQLDEHKFITVNVEGYKDTDPETGKEIYWHPAKVSKQLTLQELLRKAFP